MQGDQQFDRWASGREKVWSEHDRDTSLVAFRAGYRECSFEYIRTCVDALNFIESVARAYPQYEDCAEAARLRAIVNKSHDYLRCHGCRKVTLGNNLIQVEPSPESDGYCQTCADGIGEAIAARLERH